MGNPCQLSCHGLPFDDRVRLRSAGSAGGPPASVLVPNSAPPRSTRLQPRWRFEPAWSTHGVRPSFRCVYRARRPTLRECAPPYAPGDALEPSSSLIAAGESILRARLALAFASHCRLRATNAEREARRRRQRHPLRLARPLTPSMGLTIFPQARASAELAEFRAGTKQCRDAVAALQDTFRARGPCSAPSASHEKLGTVCCCAATLPLDQASWDLPEAERSCPFARADAAAGSRGAALGADAQQARQPALRCCPPLSLSDSGAAGGLQRRVIHQHGCMT